MGAFGSFIAAAVAAPASVLSEPAPSLAMAITPAALAVAPDTPALPYRLPPLLWKSSPNFSSRKGARVDLIVLHSTEGGYGGSVAWFQQSRSAVSAHFVLREDGAEATQMVHLADKAWHACAFNARSIGLECAGFAAKGLADAEWRAAAAIVAYLLHHLQIPLRFARAGVGPGFCRHFDLGKAGGGHGDPTTSDAVWQRVMALITEEYAKVDAGHVWEHDSAPAAACRLNCKA